MAPRPGHTELGSQEAQRSPGSAGCANERESAEAHATGGKSVLLSRDRLFALSRVRQPLGDQRRMKFAVFVESTLANDVVAVFHLAGVDVIDFLVAVILAHPFR